jgi:cytochrome c
MEGDREGPRLAGVFGRKAGSVPGFEYTLEKWLTDPDIVVPDNKMDFHAPSPRSGRI